MMTSINLLGFTTYKPDLTDVRGVHVLSTTLANCFADNDFSEFQKPDHYIRHIGERVHVQSGTSAEAM
jgi:hypothetical protein